MSDSETMARESAAYIKRREEELYAAVTEKARQESQLLAMVRDAADPALIEAAIAAKAQIERDIPIIARDLSLSAQSANLIVFMTRMEVAIAGFAGELAGLRTDVRQLLSAEQKNTRGLKTMQTQMQESQTDRQQLHAAVAEVKDIVTELGGRLDAYVAGSKRDQLDGVARDVAELKAWRAALEARDEHDG